MAKTNRSKYSVLTTIFAVLLTPTGLAQTNNETLGSGAGSSITTGDNNVLLGDFAGTGLSSGSSNTMVGSGAGIQSNA
ncbi:MAG: hypothetical protein AAF680_08045, partial [Pseudomonadota bacterium]